MDTKSKILKHLTLIKADFCMIHTDKTLPYQ